MWLIIYPKVNSLRPIPNRRHFADDTFKRIFLIENVRIQIKISLKFVPKGPINNNPALILIMAWRRSGDKPLSEPMMVSLVTHICVTRPQWVKVTQLWRQICGGTCREWLHTYMHTYIHTYLLLLISMLWHRQAIFKSKGDKLCSSAESRIWTRDPRHQIANRLNARWQTDWAIEDQA